MNREDLAEQCRGIERDGLSVLVYLRFRGCISPWGTWFRLQKEELGRKDWQITDGKGQEGMKKITLENKKKAVEIALCGGNPLEYLKSIGSANPSASWYYIKKSLQEADPGKYALLTGAKPETEEKKEENEMTCCAPSTRKGVEVPDEVPKEEDPVKPEVVLTIKSEDLTRAIDETPHASSITKPVNYDGFEVMALKSPDTGFRFVSDPRYGMMTWNTVSGDEVSLTAEEWHKMADELPKALQIFGI